MFGFADERWSVLGSCWEPARFRLAGAALIRLSAADCKPALLEVSHEKAHRAKMGSIESAIRRRVGQQVLRALDEVDVLLRRRELRLRV